MEKVITGLDKKLICNFAIQCGAGEASERFQVPQLRIKTWVYNAGRPQEKIPVEAMRVAYEKFQMEIV